MNIWMSRFNLGLMFVAAAFLFLSVGTIGFIPVKLHSLSAKPKLPELPQYSPFTTKPLNAYLDRLNSHALFYIPETQVASLSTEPTLDAILQKYQLIGVVGGTQPAAIIQNISDNTTHLVQPGEMFDQLKVVEVLSKSILVDYHGNQKIVSLQDVTS